MTHRTINFYAGPAGLPLPALERAQEELLDFAGTGMSVMEISHRSKPFDEIMIGAEADMRALGRIYSSTAAAPGGTRRKLILATGWRVEK